MTWETGEGDRAARDWAREILADITDEAREGILAAGHAESWRAGIELMDWDERFFGPRPSTDLVLGYMYLEAHDWARTGRQLAVRRESLGLSREQLAARIGSTPQEIASWEIGRRPPTDEEWGRLRDALAGATWSPSK